MTKLNDLNPGDRFVVVGLEDEELELIKLMGGSAYVRSATRVMRRAFVTYDGQVVKPFSVPSGGYHISRATCVVLC